jgi:hypothetical protein
VTNSSGSSLFKVYYSANMEDDVTVSIFNQSGKLVFTEKLRNTDGFIRPYNFERLDEGDYTIEVENDGGKHVEKIHYSAGKIEKMINVVKLADEGKYLLTVASKGADNVTINIYDDHNELIHSQERFVEREFAEVINLKNRKTFTIEITDSSGLLKSLKY